LRSELEGQVDGRFLWPFLIVEKKFEKVVHNDTPDTTFVQLCQV
jgi:hypothetical protein